MDSSRITTAFGAESTAMQVIAGIDLTGQRALVTGASSGIGVETARALASAGAEVTLAVRDLAAGQRTAAGITATTGNPAIHVGWLDLAEQLAARRQRGTAPGERCAQTTRSSGASSFVIWKW